MNFFFSQTDALPLPFIPSPKIRSKIEEPPTIDSAAPQKGGDHAI